jgi:N-acetylglucosamine malate deacetylase 1
LTNGLHDNKRGRKNLLALRHIINANPPPCILDIKDISPENVLVLAPHPDDEIIGCGGTIIRHKKMGSKILIAYLTDGRASNKGIESEKLATIRREEAKAGLKIMGCSEHLFMDFPDSRLCEFIKECAEGLDQIIDDFKPDSIFVPSFFDVHLDHSATAKILARAIEKQGPAIMCYAYEVWTPIVPNTIIDISDVMKIKLDALGAHKSQLLKIDYVQKVEGLNSYRSIYIGNRARYCEAFLKSSQKEYIRISSFFD